MIVSAPPFVIGRLAVPAFPPLNLFPSKTK